MAALPEVDFIWMDGELVKWQDAKIHVLSHALHYGSGVFEGIRCYDTPAGPAIFRLTDHMERLHRSAKLIRMEVPHECEVLSAATREVIKANGLRECYIRPLVYRGYGSMGVDPTPAPVETLVAVWPWDTYLGEDAVSSGVDVGISSWRQRGNNSSPAQIKATGNYLNSALARIEANDHGYMEAILLNEAGHVCEGTGENIFVVKDEVLMTPPVSDGILEGITRESIITMAVDMDIPVLETSLARTDLYGADEIFMTGTAAEVVPVRSVDHRVVGEPGPMTRVLQDKYFRVVRGGEPDYMDWLELV